MRLRPQAVHRPRWQAAALAAALLLGTAAAQTRPPVFRAGPATPPAQPLPQPAAANFISEAARSGGARWTVQGNKGTFVQGATDRIVINWSSFNIGAGFQVEFQQNPDTGRAVSALNRVVGGDPSIILGQLRANRELILVNPNGVYFGAGAQVDTGRFVASTLALADAVFERGLRNSSDGSAVFAGAANRDAAISLAAGAEIRVAAGGDVLLLAPRVLNEGSIVTPQGQAVLAAGERIYLTSSTDPAQRGLIVAADPVLLEGTLTPDPSLGRVENLARGLDRIQADSGSVNLVGLLVRQAGQVNASTAVRGANGSITLQAMASTQLLSSSQAAERGLAIEATASTRSALALGTVELAEGSTTRVSPSTAADGQLDSEAFYASRIRIEGQAIAVGRGAHIEAPGGRIELLAAQGTGVATATHPLFATPGSGQAAFDVLPDSTSRIVVAPGALISAAGVAAVPVDGRRNQAGQRLFRIELADAPVQRDGALYREAVVFDRRGAAGIAVADVSAATQGITRSAAERSSAGGTVRLESAGALALGEGARLDVSGGWLSVSQATLNTTLLRSGGGLVLFDRARADLRVDGIAGSAARPQPAYDDGAAGGSLVLAGSRMALDGEVSGSVRQGALQQDGSSARAAPAQLQVGRAGNAAYLLPELQLRATPAAAGAAAALQADPLGAAVTSLSAPLSLALPTVAAAGFGALTLRATRIEQPEHARLDLGIGGRFDAQADRLGLDAEVRASGGRITLATRQSDADSPTSGRGDIVLSSDSVLDVAGRWRNDNLLAAAASGAGMPSDRGVALGGGRIDIDAAHSLQLDGSRLDASAGAALLSGGSVERGTPGAVSLRLGGLLVGAPRLSMAGAQVQAFGFADGGSLTLNLRDLELGADAGGALAPLLDGRSGFAHVTVNAFGDLHLAEGLQLAPVLHNWQLAEGFRSAGSGAMHTQVAGAVALDTALVARRPVNLAFNATRTLDPALQGATLTVQGGAAVRLEPGGRLALSATRELLVGTEAGSSEALLAAPGGSITLTVRGERSPAQDGFGYLPSQALWLGPQARLLVDGTAQLRADSSPPRLGLFTPGGSATPAAARRSGTVFGGGSIELVAERGRVVVQPGAQLSLDGAAADLHLPGLPNASTVAKPGGTLAVRSADGWVLDGTVSAAAPRDTAGRVLADGGWLRLSLAPEGDPGAGNVNLPPHPTGARELRLVADGPALSATLAPGADLGAALGVGTGHTPTALLLDSGFSGVALAAGDAIHFQRSLALEMPLGVEFAAPALRADAGVDVSARASRVLLGDAAASRTGTAADSTAVAGSSRLALRADSIDLVGRLGLQGFGETVLDAAGGDIRFLNAVFDSREAALNFGGSLRLSAGRVYAASRVRSHITGLAALDEADSGSRLRIESSAGAADGRAPLSAFGTLALKATTIEQAGVLWQPFGRIDIEAGRGLTLARGSLTSVSGSDGAQLLGQTNNLDTWLVQGSETRAPLLEPAVGLTATQIDAAAGARVSASGGGRVLAWEFFAGVGGSSDTLAAGAQWAVLPDLSTTTALGEDSLTLAASGARGQQIVITQAGAGLAPGRYQLLPARYVLLGDSLPQGAFVVRRSPEQGQTVLRQALPQQDGAVIVTGYVSSSGSSTVGVPGERFVVEPLATVRGRSEYRLSDVATLLPASGPRPGDGGSVQLRLGEGLSAPWRAALTLGAGSGAAAGVARQAGTLDIAASRLALQDGPADDPRFFVITPDTLAGSGAASVLLGAVRSRGDGGDGSAPVERLDASATREVRLAPAQPLVLGELLVAASDRVEVAAATVLSAAVPAVPSAAVPAVPSAAVPAGGNAAPSRTLRVQGEGALLALSSGELALERSSGGADGATAQLDIGAASRLAGRSVLLDSSAALQLDATAQASATRLGLGAQRLQLGAAEFTAPGTTVVAGAWLEAALGAQELLLRGSSGIDLAGTVRDSSGTRQALVIDTPVLRGIDGPAGSAAQWQLQAADIRWAHAGGSAGADTGDSAAMPASAGSTLRLWATPPLRFGRTGGLQLAGGALALAGFAEVTLASQGDLVLAGTGSLDTAADLVLQAARITGTGRADQQMRSSASLTLRSASDGRSLGELAGVGGRLGFSARVLTHEGRIDLPGGQVILAGQDALVLAPGSRVDSSAPVLQGSASWQADAAAGRIELASERGDVRVQGLLRADAAASGDGGHIELQAPRGTLLLDGATLSARGGRAEGDRGGSLRADLGRLASADTLAAAATAGGIGSAFSLRVRDGDVALTQALAQPLKAARIAIAADTGSIQLDTTLDARAAAGGVVTLDAGRHLGLGAAARIDARATDSAAADGGTDVRLAAGSGTLTLDPGARVDSGQGRVVLRARRDGAGLQLAPFDSTALTAGEVLIEAVRRYDGVNTLTASGGSASALSLATVLADNTAWLATGAALLDALGVARAERGRISLRPGVEVRSTGDLTLAADWALQTSSAGVLTLRAAGNLVLNGSISDGFSSAAANATFLDRRAAWSLRLAAGADLAAADPLAVQALAEVGTSRGTLSLGSGRRLRTGAGSIALAAARDLQFAAGAGATPAAQVVVAGRLIDGHAELMSALFGSQLARPTFTDRGGRIELHAGRDIVAPAATQLVSNALWRSGVLGADGRYAASSQLAWWTEFAQFRQTVGAFGGGGAFVEAGRDIVNLQVLASDAGWASSRDPAAATLRRLGAPTLELHAAGTLRGGTYGVGRGDGRLRAEAGIVSAPAGAVLERVLVGSGGGDWRIVSGGDIEFGSSFSPTLLAVPSARASVSSFFTTWDNSSRVDLRAAGSVVIGGAGLDSTELPALGLANDPLAVELLRLQSPSLSVLAAAGDITLGETRLLLAPSAQGRLALWAGGNLGLPSNSKLALSDVAPADLADALRSPVDSRSLFGFTTRLTAQLSDSTALTGLRSGLAGAARLHAEGDILASSALGASLLLPTPVTLSAGGDILGLALRTQQFEKDDVSRISAGGDIRLLLSADGIESAGPGRLELSAGGTVDLGSAVGLVSSGNSRNAALPAAGAAIRVAASQAVVVDVDALVERYLQAGGSPLWRQHRDTLNTAVGQALASGSLGDDEALAQFRRFPAQAQARVAQAVLAAEFAHTWLQGPAPDVAAVSAALAADFDTRRQDLLAAAEAALARGSGLELPGRATVAGAELAALVAQWRALRYADLDSRATVSTLQQQQAQARTRWREAVAADLGSTPEALDGLAGSEPTAPLALSWRAALAATAGATFERVREQTAEAVAVAAAAEASAFGRQALPLRLASFDQSLAVLELAGQGLAVPQPVWPRAAPLLARSGSLDLTQSGIVTQRGGDITLVNPGGAINVGLKDASAVGNRTLGVVARGGGDVLGLARDDFQVNTQRVFIVGQGDMAILTAQGDIDSGRGANTAIGTPPLVARRGADGVVFELPATTTGSGLGIVPDASGRAQGTIGLYPAFGEILALDAFIRAPSIVLGATVRGADNLGAGSVSGAAAAVAAPPPALSSAAPSTSEPRGGSAATAAAEQARQRQSLLTVELLGIGPGEPCEGLAGPPLDECRRRLATEPPRQRP